VLPIPDSVRGLARSTPPVDRARPTTGEAGHVRDRSPITKLKPVTEPQTQSAKAEAIRNQARHARSMARWFFDDGDLQRLKRYADELDQQASELNGEAIAGHAMPPASAALSGAGTLRILRRYSDGFEKGSAALCHATALGL
jgi:hypothetical protein